MKIGIAGPISLDPLRSLLSDATHLPRTYSFPLIGVLARELHDRGHHLTVFAGSVEVENMQSFTGDRLEIIVIPLRRRGAAYNFYRQERRYLSDAMRNSGCDLIHAHWTYEFAASALASGLPHLITAHDAPLAIQRYFITTRAAPHWLCRLLLAAYVLKRARRLTAVSPYLADHLRHVFHPRAEITVVPNGVNDRLFDRGAQRSPTKSKGKSIMIATVLEGFSKRKNAKIGLKGFAIFRQQYPDARLRMFGTDFGVGQSAHQWAKQHGLDEGVDFMGKVPQAGLFDSLVNDTDVLLHPALEESHPMAICEAMALGLPVIGGQSSGGVPFTLDEGRAGLLVNVRSPAAVAEGLARMAQESAIREHFSHTGWNFARSHFSVSQMVEAYGSIYREVLKEKQGG